MKVCFIGTCGHTKKAYNFLKKRPDVVFCGIAPGSVHEGLTASFSPEIPFYCDYRAMLDSLKPDLAVVSPVFGLTGRVIMDCADRGIHVFSEKPIASSYAELKAVKESVKKNGIRFCAMHYLRFSPAFYHGAKLVQDSGIGNLRLITAQKSYKFGNRPSWYSDRSLYGGTILWVGIHAIDWISFFSGKRFCSVNALAFGSSPEKTALCQFELADGILASVNLDYYRPDAAPTHDDDRIRCVGTEGILEIRENTIFLCDKNGCHTILPDTAPDLLEEFIEGRDPIPQDELFYLAKVALAAQEAADTHTIVRIED